jgi:hypothetical protein
MSSEASKLVPLFLTIAGTGYCVWPYVQPASPPAPPKLELPKIEASWLSPAFAAASRRNVFEQVVPKSAAPAKSQGDDTAARLAEKAALEAKRKEELLALKRSIALGATMVHGARRGAVLNGRAFLEGETVPSPRGGGKSLVLVEVARDHVVLQPDAGSEKFKLEFSPARRAMATSAGGARPAAAAAPKIVTMMDRLMAAMNGGPNPESPAPPPVTQRATNSSAAGGASAAATDGQQ